VHETSDATFQRHEGLAGGLVPRSPSTGLHGRCRCAGSRLKPLRRRIDSLDGPAGTAPSELLTAGVGGTGARAVVRSAAQWPPGRLARASRGDVEGRRKVADLPYMIALVRAFAIFSAVAFGGTLAKPSRESFTIVQITTPLEVREVVERLAEGAEIGPDRLRCGSGTSRQVDPE
jgi:hypothetical protein